MWYPIAQNRRIESTKDYKLVETLRKTTLHKDTGSVTEHDIITKTYAACKPVEIIKHKNPLDFLNMQQKYTFRFKGPEKSGCFTAAFKTLPEIVSILKDGNALCDLGLNVAINAQLKGFEHDKLLQTNDDMDLTGFFPEAGQESKGIICSNVDSEKFDFNSDIDKQRLREGLEYINDLAANGYEKYNRLNVLSHVLLFGIIGPFAFVFKVVKALILEPVDLYGNPNTTNTISGIIALAINGHEKDDDYLISGTQADTIPRLGDAICNTTFPKVIDELIIPDTSLSPSRRQKQEEDKKRSM